MNITDYVYANNTGETVPQKLIKQYTLTLEYIFERKLHDDYMEFLVDIKRKSEFAEHMEAIEFDLSRFEVTEEEINNEPFVIFPEAPILSAI